MSTMQRRIAALERRAVDAPMSPGEQRQRMTDWYASMGTTREQVMALPGGEPAFVYEWLKRPSTAPDAPDDGLTAGERYLAMLG